MSMHKMLRWEKKGPYDYHEVFVKKILRTRFKTASEFVLATLTC